MLFWFIVKYVKFVYDMQLLPCQPIYIMYKCIYYFTLTYFGLVVEDKYILIHPKCMLQNTYYLVL